MAVSTFWAIKFIEGAPEKLRGSVKTWESPIKSDRESAVVIEKDPEGSNMVFVGLQKTQHPGSN